MTADVTRKEGTPFIFAREAELQALADRFRRRRPLLIHGPRGVGKTLVVTHVLQGFPEFLYSPDSSTVVTVLRSIALQLWRLRSPRVLKSVGTASPDALKTKSVMNLRGVVFGALKEAKYCLVLDHIKRPPYSFSSTVRELMGWCGTPVITISRSPHMEDAGFLQPFYPDRADQLAFKNFEPEAAEAFALRTAEDLGLHAENFAEFLDRVLEHSEGNPGAIVRMLEMGKLPKYRSGEHIKTAPLYIDYRLSV